MGVFRAAVLDGKGVHDYAQGRMASASGQDLLRERKKGRRQSVILQANLFSYASSGRSLESLGGLMRNPIRQRLKHFVGGDGARKTLRKRECKMNGGCRESNIYIYIVVHLSLCQRLKAEDPEMIQLP